MIMKMDGEIVVEDGWGDDDDNESDIDFEEDRDMKPESAGWKAESWSLDDTEEITSASQPKPKPKPEEEEEEEEEEEVEGGDGDGGEEELALELEVLAYVESLTPTSSLIEEVNERLQKSASEGAEELSAYYRKRPNLREYTLNTELPRMDYRVLLPNTSHAAPAHVELTTQKDIRNYFHSSHNNSNTNSNTSGSGDDENGGEVSVEEILLRAANQSLLADVLVALTGTAADNNDAKKEAFIIRTDFLATAVATQWQSQKVS